ASGQLMRASVYRPLIVAYRNGAPIRLDQIGNVADSVQNDKVVGWYNNEGAVILAVQRQPGTNTVDVVDGVMKILPQFRAIVPPSIHLITVYDRSQGIRESVNDVKFTLFLAICMVVMVIFLFLRNLSATVIPSIALPMSLVGTFAVMYLLNYTIDNLSMMAMTLSVGFVVDDAIVMLENIVRHMEMGESPLDAAIKGSREIGFTIVSMTLALTAVFIPVFFMSGIIGRLLHEFAVVIMVAVLVSGFVSLTLTPMLCSRFLRGQQELKHGSLYMSLENFFDWLLRKYDVSLQWSLRHRLSVLLFSGAILVATVWQFMVIPKGFLPEVDQSVLQGATLAAQGISYDSMVAHQRAVNRILIADPNVKGFFSTVGLTGGAGNSGFVFMHLKEPNDRPTRPSQTMLALDRKYGGVPVLGAILREATPYFAYHPDINQVMQEMRAKLSGIPGIQIFLRNPPPIQIGGNVTNSPYQFTLQSPDTEQLYQVATQFERKMQGISSLQDVTSDLQIANPQVNVNIDRDKASALGVTAQQVEDALYTAYGQRQVSTIYAPNDEYRVIMELEDQYQKDPNALSMLYIHSSNGSLVPLSAVATLTTSLGPLSVNHLGQLPAVTISFNLKPGTAIGNAVKSIEELARSSLPDSVSYQFQGTAQAFQSSLTGLGVLLLVAILVIYIVLGILYESFIHPITILSGLPSAAFGALLTLQIFHLSLDLYGFVGVIMLIGIVKKNAIMMVDFAISREREEHVPAAKAAYEGSMVRFRPIMMTTMAALFGTLPIAIGSGAGSDSRRPLGLAVCGGLIFSQLVTLYLTPVFYTYMDSFQSWLERRFGRVVGFSKPRFADESVSAD
ncbi:MAG: efflux RND transporter permease subunit, partial [Acidobacteriota bacterium]|nr:efflux RND transporter permease subunit [Acidobacteriota bacterium]